ncbi:gamma-butyrobetaine hydroxylase-like domain-containing protein [Spartinivicinus ruber]|uniref:gamma-butyrobetaine hydroxylase-like domain-containing protein n=1 Tax=Spartinivicinus ruber TaxID=2683272 RepID=UPI0013D5F5D2|nr:DUF971 domain-containing protein [Spartinivicinus ruber]
MATTAPIPQDIKLHKRSKTLELVYSDQSYTLGCEFLRVHSPSAEVRGHGKPILQTGKKHVAITGIDVVGNYALKLIFDDGHDSGLYTWEYLHYLSLNQDKLWQQYLAELHQAGASRDPDTSVVKLVDL